MKAVRQASSIEATGASGEELTYVVAAFLAGAAR